MMLHLQSLCRVTLFTDELLLLSMTLLQPTETVVIDDAPSADAIVIDDASPCSVVFDDASSADAIVIDDASSDAIVVR